MADVFLICPVRNASEEAQQKMANYISEIEGKGGCVYYPRRDTDQTDPVGDKILASNRKGMEDSEEVHIWFDPESVGSVFDIGMAWALKKPMKLANEKEASVQSENPFQQTVLNWQEELEKEGTALSELRKQMQDAEEVRITLDTASMECIFKLGMACAMRKLVVTENIEEVVPTIGKSFQNAVLNWDKLL